MGKDPRFADYRTRAKHVADLYRLVDTVTREKTTDEWLALLKPRLGEHTEALLAELEEDPACD